MKARFVGAFIGIFTPFLLYILFAFMLQFLGLKVIHSPESVIGVHTQQTPVETFADENAKIFGNRRLILYPLVSIAMGGLLAMISKCRSLALQLWVVPFLLVVHGIRNRADVISVVVNIVLVYAGYGGARLFRMIRLR